MMVASLDLSSAFYIVNVDLQIKRLRNIGLPNDVARLIEVWLKLYIYMLELMEKTLSYLISC
jgi:hypothetical protein